MRNDPTFVPEDFEFELRNKKCRGKIYKTGKTRYTASGTYGDATIEGSGAPSTRAALESWKKKAEYSEPYD